MKGTIWGLAGEGQGAGGRGQWAGGSGRGTGGRNARNKLVVRRGEARVG